MSECKAVGCTHAVWSKGYCRKHGYLVDNSKEILNKRSLDRGKGLRRISKKKLEKQVEDKGLQKELREKDVAFYSEIWAERPHYCEVTGVFLGREPMTTFFDHILEKEKYPEFRHCKWNISLLHPDVHADKAKYPELVELKRKLFEIYVLKEV